MDSKILVGYLSLILTGLYQLWLLQGCALMHMHMYYKGLGLSIAKAAHSFTRYLISFIKKWSNGYDLINMALHNFDLNYLFFIGWLKLIIALMQWLCIILFLIISVCNT
jgi:hypothetical protein